MSVFLPWPNQAQFSHRSDQFLSTPQFEQGMDLFASVLNRGRPSSSSSPAAPAVHRSSAAILKRWRQLVSRAYYVVSAAFCQQLSWELLALAGISSDAIQRSAGGRLMEASAKSVPAHRQHGVTWVIGARIGDSTMKGKAQKMFNECQHEVSNLIDAGNKHKYWRTCRTCHGRWDRIPLCLPNPVTKPQEGAQPSPPPPPPSADAEPVTVMAPLCRIHQVAMQARRIRSSNALFWGCIYHPVCVETADMLLAGQRLFVAPTCETVDLTMSDGDNAWVVP